MNKQIATLFDRFYNIALKDKIQDPLLHSQWVYFQSMLNGTTFERQRINMYLSILENERKKKEKTSQFQFNSLIYEPKMQKRFSQPVKSDLNTQNQVLKGREDTYNQVTKSPKMMTPKTKYILRKTSVGESKQNNPTGSSFKTKAVQQKPDFRKLQQIANNLVRVFQISAYD